MSRNWQRIGAIAAGGSVLSACAGPNGQTWLATSGGLLSSSDGDWRPLTEPVPMEQVGLVAAAGRDWFLAGLAGGLILTWDGGRSWASAWLDEVAEPITCITASATYGRDITLLAGTVGAGVLRSTDGGRRWQLSNFGLEEFSTLALTTAGDWSRRQVVFAGTADGVYRSSGGGRAWKPVGLQGLVVQALASGNKPPPPEPGEPGGGGMWDASGAWAILAGTESNGLYRSFDGGYTWESCGREIGHDAGINALLSLEADSGDLWLVGTDVGSIWYSLDNGDSWIEVCQVGGPVLTLAEGHNALLAGTSEQGLWVSTDQGLTWRCDSSLSAWGFRRLECHGELGLTALAPSGGVWLSTDGGESWTLSLDASLYDPVLAYLPIGEGWLAARSEGLWRGKSGKEPVLVLEAGAAPIVALAGADRALPEASRDAVWAGAADGSVWVSRDQGVSWRSLEVPFLGQRLLGLALSPQDGTPLVGTFAEKNREVSLWRYDAERWQCWLSRSDTWPGLTLHPRGLLAEGSWAALGGKAYANTVDGWQEVDIPGHGTTVATIAGVSPRGDRYLLSAGEVMCQDGNGEWRSLPLPDASSTPIDLCILPSGVLLCLDAKGVVWNLPA